MHALRSPGGRSEERSTGFKKAPITPVRRDGFTANAKRPAAIEKVTRVSAATPPRPAHLRLSSEWCVCNAVCVI